MSTRHPGWGFLGNHQTFWAIMGLWAKPVRVMILGEIMDPAVWARDPSAVATVRPLRL